MPLDPAYQARIDAYLNSQVKPVQPPQMMTYDPQWKTVDFITPIGRILQCSLAQPKAFQPKGQPPGPPKWQLTLAFLPKEELVEDIDKAICMVANGANPQGIVRPNPNQRDANGNPVMEVFTGEQMLYLPKGAPGKFWYPLQEGNEQYMQDPQRNECYRDLLFINATAWPQTKKGTPARPVYVDQHGNTLSDGSIFGRGDYARATFQAKWFDAGQNKGVGIVIKQVQFFAKGEPLLGGGYDADAAAREAFAAAGALPMIEPPMQVGYTQAPQQPMAYPPAGVQGGFAPPPQQIDYQQAAAAAQQPQAQVPQQPQQPNWNPPATGGGAFTPPPNQGTFIPPQTPAMPAPAAAAGGRRIPGAR